MNYEANFDKVLENIEKARLETNEHQIVKIVAVSKYSDAKAVESLYKIGQRAFGENRVQDLKQKCELLEEYPLEWHFIGRLQTNKINALLDLNPFLVQSIDNYERAIELNKRAEVKGKRVNILLQINSAKEDSKAGVMPEVASEEYLKIKEDLKNLNLKGVMTIGAHSEDKELIKESFETTFKIYEELISEGATICSMGMSGDYELAIKCGSNMLRLGSVLFKG